MTKAAAHITFFKSVGSRLTVVDYLPSPPTKVPDFDHFVFLRQQKNMQCISRGDPGPMPLPPGSTGRNWEREQQCVWRRIDPTAWMFLVYALIVPVLACFGLCANLINSIVFMRPKMTPSAFTYLAALSWLDCASCLLIMLTALSRSIFFNNYEWLVYDFQWQTPLFGITTGAANLILACVSCDRLIYLRNGMTNGRGTPRFCRRQVARRMILCVILISVVVNIPYFFVFVVNADGTFRATDFYYSYFYMVHNWFAFLLLTVLPAIFLTIGNAAIISAFCRWTKQSKKCQKACRTSSKTTQKRYQHQMKLTITILIVITLYMIGELPAHLTSRKSALNLLFGGDISKVNFEIMSRMEVICITLNAFQLSLNIVVYAVINPSFMPEFFVCLRGASDVCFRVLCFTAIADCWRARLQDRRRSSQKGEKHDHERPPIAVENTSTSASWSREHDSNVQVHLSAPDVARIRPVLSKGRSRSCEHVLSTYERLTADCSWKRSSSFGELAFYNSAVEPDAAEPIQNI